MSDCNDIHTYHHIWWHSTESSRGIAATPLHLPLLGEKDWLMGGFRQNPPLSGKQLGSTELFYPWLFLAGCWEALQALPNLYQLDKAQGSCHPPPILSSWFGVIQPKQRGRILEIRFLNHLDFQGATIAFNVQFGAPREWMHTTEQRLKMPVAGYCLASGWLPHYFLYFLKLSGAVSMVFTLTISLIP